jgi:hypothetical protein
VVSSGQFTIEIEMGKNVYITIERCSLKPSFVLRYLRASTWISGRKFVVRTGLRYANFLMTSDMIGDQALQDGLHGLLNN